MSRGRLVLKYVYHILRFLAFEILSSWCDDGQYFIIKTHVRGFFVTDLHEVSCHFATHEAVRPSVF